MRRMMAASKPTPRWNRKWRSTCVGCAAAPRPMRRCDPRRSDVDQLAGGVVGVVGDAERAREHVRRAAGQRRQRGRGPGEPAGGLVERAVAGEHGHDVVGLRRPRRAPARPRDPAGRLHDVESAQASRRMRSTPTRARGGHRRRGRVHHEEHAHGGEPYRQCVNAPRRDARHEPRPAALRALDRRDRRVPRRAPASSSGASRSPGRSGPSFRDDDVLGPAGPRVRRSRTRGCSSPASRPPRTAPTAPAGSSPATARATACSPRCTAPASPTSRPSTVGRRRPRAARRLRQRRGAVRAAGEQADAGRARPVPAVPASGSSPCWSSGAGRSSCSARSPTTPSAGCWRRPAPPLPVPRPKFAHGMEVPTARAVVLGCYHPSQQNTFTGRLTDADARRVFLRARELADAVPSRP